MMEGSKVMAEAKTQSVKQAYPRPFGPRKSDPVRPKQKRPFTKKLLFHTVYNSGRSGFENAD